MPSNQEMKEIAEHLEDVAEDIVERPRNIADKGMRSPQWPTWSMVRVTKEWLARLTVRGATAVSRATQPQLTAIIPILSPGLTNHISCVVSILMDIPNLAITKPKPQKAQWLENQIKRMQQATKDLSKEDQDLELKNLEQSPPASQSKVKALRKTWRPTLPHPRTPPLAPITGLAHILWAP